MTAAEQREVAGLAAGWLRAHAVTLRAIDESGTDSGQMELAALDLAAELEARARGGPRCPVCAQQAEDRR